MHKATTETLIENCRISEIDSGEEIKGGNSSSNIFQ